MIDSVFENKEWVFSGVGVAIISFLVIIARKIYFLVKLSKQTSPLVGHYETFYFAPAEDGSITKGSAEIKMTITGLNVEIKTPVFGFEGGGKEFLQ